MEHQAFEESVAFQVADFAFGVLPAVLPSDIRITGGYGVEDMQLTRELPGQIIGLLSTGYGLVRLRDREVGAFQQPIQGDVLYIDFANHVRQPVQLHYGHVLMTYENMPPSFIECLLRAAVRGDDDGHTRLARLSGRDLSVIVYVRYHEPDDPTSRGDVHLIQYISDLGIPSFLAGMNSSTPAPT